jgi:hypothetical protein
MADITDPVVIAFLSERVRPRAEQIRALLHLLQDDRDEWLAEGIGALVPDTSDIIQDGRAAEGVAQLTGAELRLIVISRYGELLTTLEAAGAMDPIIKACVRALAVTLPGD